LSRFNADHGLAKSQLQNAMRNSLKGSIWDMALDKQAIARLHKKRAGRYNLSANAYYLFSVREFAYRKMAVQALNLEEGDTVVEIGFRYKCP
jgi:hypothetical protein